jgi:hypothetical protein
MGKVTLKYRDYLKDCLFFTGHINMQIPARKFILSANFLGF